MKINSIHQELVFFQLYKTNFTDDELSRFAYDKVKSIALQYTNLDKIEILKDEYGKPYLKNCQSMSFSISHTENFVAIAFAENRYIGIDIERIHSIDTRIIQKFYSEKEKETIQRAENKELTECEIWTCKEAHCKCTGEGLSANSLRWDAVEHKEICESFCQGDIIISICVM